MDENVLFNPTNSGSGSTNPVPSEGPPRPQATASTNPAPPSQSPPPQTPSSPPPPISHGGGIKGLLLKGGVVLLVLGILVVLVLFVIMPFLSRSNSEEEVTLTYWGLWEADSTMESVINEFESEYPNITVEYERRDVDKYRQTLQTRIGGGDGPDVFLYHNSWVPIIVGFLSPVTSSVISPEDFENIYYPVIQKDLTLGGAVYGIPMGIDTLALFVNDSIFEETGASVPKTWEDFTNVSAGVTVKDGTDAIRTYGSSLGAYDNVNRAPEILSLLFLQNRVDLLKPENTTPSMQEALRFYTDFVTGQDNIETVWDTAAPPAVISFAGGNVGMYFGYSWDIFTIKQLSPDLRFSVHPVPKLQEDLTIASYWVNGVSSKTTHPEEAQLFLAFLARKETQEKLYAESSKTRLFGLPPARRDMADLVKDNPFVYPFVQQAEAAESSYFVSDTFDDGLNNQMNAYLGNAVRSVLGNTSVESATETLVSGMNEVMGQYGLK